MATENDPCFQVLFPPAVLKGTTETELNELRVDPNSVQETGTELGEELGVELGTKRAQFLRNSHSGVKAPCGQHI